MKGRLVVGPDGRIYFTFHVRDLGNNRFEIRGQSFDVTADFHRIAKGRKK